MPPNNPQLCQDTCSFSRNGFCQDGGPGSVGDDCHYGEDCSDCLPRNDFPPPAVPPPTPPAVPPSPSPPMLCLNTCEESLISNGFCQDGGEGALGAGCQFGTDCDDCGPRPFASPPLPPSASTPSSELVLAATSQPVLADADSASIGQTALFVLLWSAILAAAVIILAFAFYRMSAKQAKRAAAQAAARKQTVSEDQSPGAILSTADVVSVSIEVDESCAPPPSSEPVKPIRLDQQGRLSSADHANTSAVPAARQPKDLPTQSPSQMPRCNMVHISSIPIERPSSMPLAPRWSRDGHGRGVPCVATRARIGAQPDISSKGVTHAEGAGPSGSSAPRIEPRLASIHRVLPPSSQWAAAPEPLPSTHSSPSPACPRLATMLALPPPPRSGPEGESQEHEFATAPRVKRVRTPSVSLPEAERLPPPSGADAVSHSERVKRLSLPRRRHCSSDKQGVRVLWTDDATDQPKVSPRESASGRMQPMHQTSPAAFVPSPVAMRTFHICGRSMSVPNYKRICQAQSNDNYFISDLPPALNFVYMSIYEMPATGLETFTMSAHGPTSRLDTLAQAFRETQQVGSMKLPENGALFLIGKDDDLIFMRTPPPPLPSTPPVRIQLLGPLAPPHSDVSPPPSSSTVGSLASTSSLQRIMRTPRRTPATSEGATLHRPSLTPRPQSPRGCSGQSTPANAGNAGSAGRVLSASSPADRTYLYI